MRLIDADKIIFRWSMYENKWIAYKDSVDELPIANVRETTTWLGDFSPYTCEHCGFHVDSKTRYCPDCGRKAVNV